VWRESEDAIGELLRSDSPQLVGDLDYHKTVDSSWWADRSVTIELGLLGSQDLFEMAGAARESGDLVPLLWHVLAWGVMGDLRNAPTVVRSAEDSVGRSRLNDILAGRPPQATAATSSARTGRSTGRSSGSVRRSSRSSFISPATGIRGRRGP
jgi:hypothetical protein